MADKDRSSSPVEQSGQESITIPVFDPQKHFEVPDRTPLNSELGDIIQVRARELVALCSCLIAAVTSDPPPNTTDLESTLLLAGRLAQELEWAASNALFPNVGGNHGAH